MKKRLTVLTGAGLTSGKEFFNITTLSLTQKFLKYHHKDLSLDKKLIKFIYEEFCFWNKLKPSEIQNNLSKINFETILQIVEELHAYVEDYERTNLKYKDRNSIKSTVYTLNRRLISHFNSVRINKGKYPIYQFLEKLYNHMIDIISKDFAKPNLDSGNVGMNKFTDFLNMAYPDDLYVRRLYTLNYDNWLSQYAHYFDGFYDENFDSRSVIQNRDINTYYNLHGCILWEHMRTKKLATPTELKYTQSFNDYTIGREALLPSNIISGYNKSTRINSEPYLELFHSFTSDCLCTDNLLIIGYGFQDPHVNSSLRLTPKNIKITIVVYHDLETLRKHGSELLKLLGEINNTFNSSFTKLKTDDRLNSTIYSDDDRISVFTAGIGDLFYNEFSKM